MGEHIKFKYKKIILAIDMNDELKHYPNKRYNLIILFEFYHNY